MICYAFDCDNTLDISQGPVPVSALHKLIEQGHLVYIVSGSGFCAQLDIPRFTPAGARNWILDQLKKKVKADRYVYVGDTEGDLKAAQSVGWEFVYARDFALCR